MGDNVILHWNGTAWAVITNTTSALRAVAANSETNAWAVGDEGVILQWDGTTWNAVSSPTTVTLKSIDMVSPTEGWAVGGIAIEDIMVGIYEGAILHWDGNNWSIFTTTTYIPTSVDMLSATDGWIGGGTDWAGSGKILHWTGTTWQEVAHPVIGKIFSIAMVSADEGWAVAGGLPDPLHWDGDAWTVFDAPGGGGAIATLPSAEFWIGGTALLYLPPISSVYLPMLCQ
jgi:hypothetical protein